MDRTIKASALIGLAAPIFTFTCILVAIVSWQPFSWTNNALSDLGVQSGLTATVFSSGLIIGGIMFVAFAVGLLHFTGKDLIGKIACLTFLLACISLICIGIFNESFKPIHFLFSAMLFVFVPIAMLIFVVAFWLEGKRKLSGLSLTLAIVAATVWVLQYTVHYVPNVAIPEAVSGLAGAGWVWVTSWLMLKNAADNPKKS